MTAINKLTEAPPYEVETAIKKLGDGLRTARIRRELTIEDVAERIGTGPRAIRSAEEGSPTAAIVTYVALLWAYGLTSQLDDVADPYKDREGIQRMIANQAQRVRKHSKGLDRNF